MIGTASAALLPDGRRLHLHHGPIDIIAEAFGTMDEVSAAYAQAARRFESVLAPLVEELALLRTPIGEPRPLPRFPVARRMVAAVWPHRAVFITPMAAVAGAVADEVLAAMVKGRTLSKAYVNNGGDIALHLTVGERFVSGIVDDQDRPSIDAMITLKAEEPVRGLATSGWRGRSFSLGIADAVTVLARDGATADAAATLIANAVTVEHRSIVRKPASALRDDTDLGEHLVTVEVGPLPHQLVVEALARGMAEGRRMQGAGQIVAAYLALQGEKGVVAPTYTIASSRQPIRGLA